MHFCPQTEVRLTSGFRRIIFIALLALFGIQTARAASVHAACEVILLEPLELDKQITDTLSAYGKDSRLLQKFIMKTFLAIKNRKQKLFKKREKDNMGRLHEELRNLCRQKGGCSKALLADLMTQELEGITSASRTLKHALSMAALASGVAILEPHISLVLPEEIQGWSRVFSYGLVAVVAVLAKPAKVSIEQLVESATLSKDVIDKTQEDNNRRMIKGNQRANHVYSDSGLKGADRIDSYLARWVNPTIKELKEIRRRPESEERDREAIDVLANMALHSRNDYNDMYDKNRQAEESISSSFYILFTQYLAETSVPIWKSRFLEAMKKYDTETAEPTVVAYYEHMVDVWFAKPGQILKPKQENEKVDETKAADPYDHEADSGDVDPIKR